MEHSRKKKYSVTDVLAVLDGSDSEFDELDYDTDSSGEQLGGHVDDLIATTPEDPVSSTSSDDEIVVDNDDGDCSGAVIIGQPANSKTNYEWCNTVFAPPNIKFTGQPINEPPVLDTRTALQYFSDFITPAMIESMVEHTNQYSIQKSGSSIGTTTKELEQVMGMYFRMGIVKMPGFRVYWETVTRYEPVASYMSRNRFLQIMSMIHFTDNLGEHDSRDKL